MNWVPIPMCKVSTFQGGFILSLNWVPIPMCKVSTFQGGFILSLVLTKVHVLNNRCVRIHVYIELGSYTKV